MTSIDPIDGNRLRGPLTDYNVNFNDTVLLTTLQPSDLTVDGVAATGVTIVDGNTATFILPGPLAEGIRTVAIAAGAIDDIQGTPIDAFSATFYNDVTPPRVVASSIQEGDVLSTGDLVYTVTFSEPMRTTDINPSDAPLYGQLRGNSYLPTSITFDASGTTATIIYAGLADDAYTLTLISGDGAFEDVVGWDLDGEPVAWPIPPNESGDGVEGGNFYVDFATDVGPQALPPRWLRWSRWAA